MECRVKNAMREHGRYRGEFYYHIKRFFYCRHMPEQRKKIPFPLRIQIFGKGERVLTRSTDRSFPQNQFERRRTTKNSSLDRPTDRSTVFGTSVLISRHGMEWKRGKNKRRGEVFTLESGTTPTNHTTTRLHIHRERRGE